MNVTKVLAHLVWPKCALSAAPTIMAAEGDPLAQYKWKARVLVVLTDDPSGPALSEQKRQLESLRGGRAGARPRARPGPCRLT
jgi:hypothetical protein